MPVMYSMNGSHGINDWNQTRVAYLTWNLTERNRTQTAEEPSLRWGIFGLLIIILFSAMGNLLVCLAVCWERRLQNMTNYFLMSLAIADFLVSLLVMPLGMIVELYGKLQINIMTQQKLNLHFWQKLLHLHELKHKSYKSSKTKS